MTAGPTELKGSPVPAGTPQGADTAAATLGLGIDVGGTAARWALADASGAIVASGEQEGFTALMMGNQAGQAQVAQNLAALGRAVLGVGLGAPAQARMGITGDTGSASERPVLRELTRMLAQALGTPEHQVTVSGDIVFAYHAAFAPGEGYLVYAGTGSIAIHVDAQGTVHRAGGHGSWLGDEGSGYWIAREALRHIWRTEDREPGAWQASALAQAVFDDVGGSDWAHTRDFFYQRPRGEVGKLALAVARAADADPVALDILQRAGREMAELARVFLHRFGARPVGIAGRVPALHPIIETSLRQSLLPHHDVRLLALETHVAAARAAASTSPARPSGLPPSTGENP